MNEEIILDKLRKMLFTTQQANECGLSNNDFKEDIQILSGAIGLIENLLKRNKELEKYEKYYQNETNLLDSYIPKSLVREKMEKYKKQIEKMEKEDIGIGFTLGKEWSDLKAKVEFGQDLLNNKTN